MADNHSTRPGVWRASNSPSPLAGEEIARNIICDSPVSRHPSAGRLLPLSPGTLLIAAALFLTPTAAFAQDTTVDPVISVGSRNPDGVRADRIGSAVTIIGPEAIENRQVRLVQDVLRDVPGLAVSRTFGSLTQVRTRGSEGNHTLVLIDGIEAADPFLGEFDYATLLADDTARIEVLRGPQSALYGSDAVAGVISYLTPSGREAPGLSVRAEAGTFDTWGLALRQGGVAGDLDYALAAAHQVSGGFANQTDGLGTRRLGSQMNVLAGKAVWRLTGAAKLRAAVRYTRSDGDVNNADFARGSLIYDSPGTATQLENAYGLLALDYEAMDGLWSHSLQLQGARASRDGFNSSGFSPFVRDSRSEGGRIKASYVTTFRIEGPRVHHTLTGAVDAERETFQNVASPFGADLTRRRTENLGFVADYAADLGGGRAGWGLSLRQDENDLFEDAFTWRAQGYWRATPALRLRTAAGTGFKTPNQSELFGFNAAIFPFAGNPGLSPETSQSWEVGADLSLAGGRAGLSATWFDAALEDEIVTIFPGGTRPAGCPDPGAGFTTTCNLASESTRQGLEFEARAQVGGGLSLDAALTLMEAREGGFAEIRRPDRLASVNLNWRSADERIGATLTVRYNGPMQDDNFTSLTPGSLPNDPPFTPLPSPPNPFGRVELPAYTLVNLAGSWALTPDIDLFGRVENLLDEDFWEVIGYRNPGRAVFAGLRKRF